MKTRILSMIAAALCMLGLSSCFKQEIVLTVNPDGSGLIEENVQISESPMLGGGEDADPLKKLLDEEQYKKHAASYGEGVTFDKVEEVKAPNGHKAAKVTFKVADVNKLTLDASKSATSSALGNGVTPASGSEDAKMVVKYANGVLTLENPNNEMNLGDEGGDQVSEIENMPDAQFNMMKGMMGDISMAFRLKVNGTISETNATYNDNGTITLMEMNMGKIMESKDNMLKMAKLSQEKDKEAVKTKIKEVNGIKVETADVITVKFK